VGPGLFFIEVDTFGVGNFIPYFPNIVYPVLYNTVPRECRLEYFPPIAPDQLGEIVDVYAIGNASAPPHIILELGSLIASKGLLNGLFNAPARYLAQVAH
jgi:hypothetical protein